MDAKLIKAEAAKFAKEVGPRAEIWISMGSGWSDAAIRASIYTRGVSHDATLWVTADDWAGLFTKLHSEWTKHAVRARRETIRSMALEIIRLTADGNCTDAALRGNKFTAEEVAEYGAEACTEADSMASNGPFEIRTISRSNAA